MRERERETVCARMRLCVRVCVCLRGGGGHNPLYTKVYDNAKVLVPNNLRR